MAWYNEDFLRAIPKTDLHVHLDGSLRIPTLIDLAREAKVNLPAWDEVGLRKLVFKDNYSNLEEYLRGFAYTTAVMQSEDAIERVAAEFMEDNAAEGVRYVEVRFAPQLHMSEKLSFRNILEAVDRGMRKVRDRLNASLSKNEPLYEYGIITCAMRFCAPAFSSYYRDFFKMHEFSKPIEIIRAASLELAKAVVQLKKDSDVQIVGFDLAGAEYGYPASDHSESYAYVHKHFLNKTVHAGEAYGPESIFQAVTKLHADRIGHGLHLFDESMIHSDELSDRSSYVTNLADYLAEHRITVEVCLTSNMQTSPKLAADITQHSLKDMIAKRLSLTLCTDNRLVSDTTVSKEIQLALNNFEIDRHVFKDIILYGFKRSFFYKSYNEKRLYVRNVIDYYESLEKKFGIV